MTLARPGRARAHNMLGGPIPVLYWTIHTQDRNSEHTGIYARRFFRFAYLSVADDAAPQLAKEAVGVMDDCPDTS